jgi:hypothetical protein
MRHVRFSVGFLMVVAAVIALDIAVMRSLFRDAPGSNQTLYLVPIDGTTSMPFGTFALGVLPMASLLLLVAFFHLPTFWRTGYVSSFWLGFATSGALSVLLFMIISALSPAATHKYLVVVSARLITPMIGMMGDEPAQWLADGVELAMGTALLMLPEMLLAIAGAWLFARARQRTLNARAGGETSSLSRSSAMAGVPE